MSIAQIIDAVLAAPAAIGHGQGIEDQQKPFPASV